MDGRNLETMIVKIAVPVMAVLLLFAASAVSMTPDDCACACACTCFGSFVRSNYFLMTCVLFQINMSRVMAREAVLAPTLAARLYYGVGAGACFLELPLKLYTILVLCPAAVDAAA